MSETIAGLYPAHVKTIQERHDRALAETGFDHVVIFGGAEREAFLDDNAYPFRVNPHLKSWAPLVNNPNCFVVYTTGRKPVLLFFSPVDYWHKPASLPTESWVESFDLRPIGKLEEARAHLPENTSRTAFVGEWTPGLNGWGLENINPEPLLNRLHFDRAWKTPYEIECLREANRIAARGHQAAEKAFRAGASEYEVHLEYLRAAGHTEAELPYGNIIAFNENAAVLHYQHQERERPAEVHSFLIDAGAQFHGYASDITRTYASGNGVFGELIDAMDELQRELIEMVRPGLLYPDLHLAAHRKIGGILGALDLVDLDPDAMVEQRVTSAFFPHGVGHYLGLQVHDVGGFMADREGTTIPKPEGHPFLRLTRTVEPDQVFTIEPGLYFIDSLLAELKESEAGKAVRWDRVDSLRRFGGVRIEDDIAVTESGADNLTRPHFA